ncbi:MAG: glycosyltransferase family 39 protein, partial [Planctomycetota bacterium]
MKVLRTTVPFLVAVAVTTSGGLLLIDRFGVTWDFQQTVLYGERYLRFFASFDPTYLDFSHPCIDYSRPHPIAEPDAKTGGGPFSAPQLVWPLPYTLAALGCRVLYLGLEWLDDPFAAHHVVNLVLVGLLAGALWQTLASSVGWRAGLAGVLLLLAYPAWLSHSFNNLRDIPVAVFFGLSLLALRPFARDGTRRYLLLFAVLQGCALASKTNAILIAPVALVVTTVVGWIRGGARVAARRGGAVLVASLFSPLVALALWPWLWTDPLHGIRQHLEFIRSVRDLDPNVDLTPWVEVACSLPVVSLALGVAGLAAARFAWRHGSFDLYLLAVLWWLAPVVRICLPRARNYGGVRHFIEFAPGWFVLAGLGFAWLVGAL